MFIASVSVILLQLMFSYMPPSQHLFGLTSIALNDWLFIVAAAAPVMLLVELEKYVQRRFYRQRSFKDDRPQVGVTE